MYLLEENKAPKGATLLPKFLRAGLSKEDAGWAHEQGRFDMDLGKGGSDSDDSTE